jgi:hypothetical protein
MQHCRAVSQNHCNGQDPKIRRLLRRAMLDCKKVKEDFKQMAQDWSAGEQTPNNFSHNEKKCNTIRKHAEALAPSLPRNLHSSNSDANICDTGRRRQNHGTASVLLDHNEATQPALQELQLADGGYNDTVGEDSSAKGASPRAPKASFDLDDPISESTEFARTERYASPSELLHTSSTGNICHELASEHFFYTWNQERIDERNRKGRERSLRTRIRNAERMNALNSACCILREQNMRAKELIQNIYLCLPVRTSIEVIMLYLNRLKGKGSGNVQGGVQDCIKYLDDLCASRTEWIISPRESIYTLEGHSAQSSS